MSLTAEAERAIASLPEKERETFVRLAEARNAVREAKSRVSSAESTLVFAKATLEKAEKDFAAAVDEAFNEAKLGVTP